MSAKIEKIDLNFNFLQLLTLIFVVMKCTGYITWSWWLVFAPTILNAAIVLIFIMIIILVAK